MWLIIFEIKLSLTFRKIVDEAVSLAFESICIETDVKEPTRILLSFKPEYFSNNLLQLHSILGVVSV